MPRDLARLPMNYHLTKDAGAEMAGQVFMPALHPVPVLPGIDAGLTVGMPRLNHGTSSIGPCVVWSVSRELTGHPSFIVPHGSRQAAAYPDEIVLYRWGSSNNALSVRHYLIGQRLDRDQGGRCLGRTLLGLPELLLLPVVALRRSAALNLSLGGFGDGAGGRGIGHEQLSLEQQPDIGIPGDCQAYPLAAPIGPALDETCGFHQLADQGAQALFIAVGSKLIHHRGDRRCDKAGMQG